ncbi:MAG: hypothetical protein GKC10_07830 [Methanosarcinales archaeon]|nr:hypothetical protein [Methanosarcinales archaeon]
MKVHITVIVISMLLLGTMAAMAINVNELSTLGKKPVKEPIALPRLTSFTPTYIAPNASPSGLAPIELSTLLRKQAASTVPPRVLGSSTPITVTPGFSIRNANVTGLANSVITPSQAIRANATVITPPFAIFGGA